MSVTMTTGLPDKPFRSWRALVYYMKATASSTDGKVVGTICCRIQIQLVHARSLFTENSL